MKTERMTGAEALIRSLLAEGVDTLFGYPGGAIMPFFDKLYDHTDHINFILTRHEQGAAHAAQGYARVTGKPGIVVATSGPGATNLITGLADAMIDSTPLICITGQVTANLLGTDAFQETDLIGITMPVTKWNFQITKPEEIPGVIARAFHIASTGRPGPVVIDFAKNAQIAEFDYSYKPCHFIRSYVASPVIKNKFIEEAADLINKAEKPLALIGQGVILGNAEKELIAFLEKTGIPAAWTILGKAAIPTDHPLNMGMLGMHGNYAPNKKTNECDVLIAIGMRFDDRVTSDIHKYARQAKVIHLEIDSAEINKNIFAHVPLLGNVKETLPKLTALVKTNLHHAWIDSFAPYAKIEQEKVIDKDLNSGKETIKMAEVVHMIGEKTGGNAVIVTDVGQHQMIASRYAKCNQTRSLITSGGLGTMGFGLPAAVGAKVGAPDREVVLFVGDGGIQMTIQELGTIMQYGIGVKIVILNNHFLGMVRQWQELFFHSRYSSTPMNNPDYITIAKAYGIQGQKIMEKDALSKAIEDMLAVSGPYLLEINVEPEGNVFPMIPAGQPFESIIFE
ncbi:MAG: biosynthetic-type acetolactate synthase large subunit [Bacteroidales bacterium]|nr:biosynthetic-type acetolactate synthase large subunit [Bacteroidales bacterium]